MVEAEEMEAVQEITPTIKPTATPTPEPVIEIPPIQLEKITTENATALTMVKMIGDGRINHLAYSPSGSLLAAASSIGVRLHGGTDLAERVFLPVSKPVSRVAFSPDGKTIAAGTEAGMILIYSVNDVLSSLDERPALALEIKASNFAVTELTFSPDGKTLANGSVDRTIQVWDYVTGKRIRSVGGFQLGVSSLTYSPDSTLLAGSSVDGSTRIWRIRTGEVLNSMGQPDKKRLNPDHYPIRLGFLPDGWLVSVWKNGEITKWDWQLETSQPVSINQSYESYSSAAITPDNSTLITSTLSGELGIREILSNEKINQSLQQKWTLQGGDGILSIVISPDGKWLASASYPAGITLWNVETGEAEKVYARYPLGLQLVASSFSPDSRFLATSHTDGLIRVWDTQNMQQYFEFQSGNGEISRSLEFSQDGRSLICGSDAIYFYSTQNFEDYLAIQRPSFSPTTRFELNPEMRIITGGLVQTTALASDHQYLASANLLGNTINIWDPISGEHLGDLYPADAPIVILKFSPSGKTLAAGSVDRKVRFWGLNEDRFSITPGEADEDGKADLVLKNDFAVLALTYSADGSQLAIAGTNWNVRVVNSQNGGLQVLLKGSRDQIFSIAASPDSILYASGGVDGMIRIYLPENSKPISTLTGHAGMVNTLNLSPDGRMLVSGGEDGTIRIWGIQQ